MARWLKKLKKWWRRWWNKTHSIYGSTTIRFETMPIVLGGPYLPPVIISDPAPSFTQGTAATYDLSQHVNRQFASNISYPITYSLSGTLGSGVTLAASTGLLSYDGAGAPSSNSHTMTITDANGSDVSGSFSIVVAASSGLDILTIPDITLAVDQTHDMGQYILNPNNESPLFTDVQNLDENIASYNPNTLELKGVSVGSLSGLRYDVSAEQPRAFRGAEGFGTETTHGRGGIIVKVTNTFDDGRAGTLREALEDYTQARIVIFTVSGTIELQSEIRMGANNGSVAVFGQTAPGDGICVRANSSSSTQPILGLGVPSSNNSAPTDVLFQHIRFRHASSNRDFSSNFDCLTFRDGAQRIVFDHCSFTWAADETIQLFRNNWDITFSHCIFGEGMVKTKEVDPTRPNDANSWGHNYGPLIYGFNGLGGSITFHHNLFIHSSHRNMRVSLSSPPGQGVQIINNVHYNCFSSNNMAYNHADQPANSTMYVDCIADYYKLGPEDDRNTSSIYCFRIRDASGFSTNPMELYLINSKRVALDGSTLYDGDNYAGGTDGFFTSDPGQVYVKRSVPITTQPENPVTITSADQAYIDLIINQDVGATKPGLDSVDQRLVTDPENGNGWESGNVVGYYGSGAFPVLSTESYYAGNPAWTTTDTSDNGLPDYYQNGVLGIDVNSDYNPAATYTVGNGYSDIENWARSLTETVTPVIVVRSNGTGDYTTIQAAVNAATPGSTIWVGAGTYNERVTIGVSGTAGNYITLRNYPGETAILDGTGLGQGRMIYGQNISYFKVIGLEIQNHDGSGIIFDNNGDHIEIRDNWIHDQERTNAYGWAIFVGARDEAAWQTEDYLTNNLITDVVIDGNTIGPNVNTGIYNNYNEALTVAWNVKRFEITNNTLDGVSHIGIDLIGKTAFGGSTVPAFPQYGRIAGNTVKNWNQGNQGVSTYPNSGIHFDGAQDIVIEDNLLADASSGTTYGIDIKPEPDGVQAQNVICRRNRIVRVTAFGLWGMGQANSVDTVRIAHNSIYMEQNHPTALGAGTDVIWKNNIARGVVNPGWAIYHFDGQTSAPTLDYNLYYPRDARYSYQTGVYAGATAFDDYQAGSGQDANSNYGDPLFIAPASNDLTPNTGSPAINGGTPLTTANGSGSNSTTLVVNDSRWFHDGMDIEGLAGDTIQVGSNTATITAINYSTHTLTLDTALTWSNGDSVSYPWNGAAPDIGAIET